ncbi:hypothetical protein BLA13014_02448 [Burkholderia aenigmatica]|uniref:Uncharacterized protein n=1 Tax=Burkholderia aenigmatica TaxID=2015348 RepID=A0A6P2KIY6_9BURK|nr:hypothetical protein BLA13014_02448 [Burkholderia aenigmatica]
MSMRTISSPLCRRVLAVALSLMLAGCDVLREGEIFPRGTKDKWEQPG